MPSQRESWRATRSWEGTQPGQLTQTGQRGIPYRVTSRPVYKRGGVGLGGIAAQELTGRRSAGGEKLHLYIWIFILLLILFSSFLSYWTVFISTHEFYFFFWFSSPSHCRGEWVSSCMAGIRPQQSDISPEILLMPQIDIYSWSLFHPLSKKRKPTCIYYFWLCGSKFLHGNILFTVEFSRDKFVFSSSREKEPW